MQEIKRMLYSKRSLVVMFFVTSLILLICYLGSSWKTYLSFDNASDMSIDMKQTYDSWVIKHSHGNVFKLWHESLYTFRIVLPILLTATYLYTYITEKATCYRYYQIARKSYLGYLYKKLLSILCGTTISIIIGQVLAFAIIYMFSSHVVHPDVMQNIVSGQYETFFLAQPYLFWGIQFLIQIGYMLSFIIFSIGIASFLKNHLYIYVLPFMFHTFISVVMPMPYKLTTVTDLFNPAFRIENYLFTMGVLIVTGVMMLFYNEKRWLNYG